MITSTTTQSIANHLTRREPKGKEGRAMECRYATLAESCYPETRPLIPPSTVTPVFYAVLSALLSVAPRFTMTELTTTHGVGGSLGTATAPRPHAEEETQTPGTPEARNLGHREPTYSPTRIQ